MYVAIIAELSHSHFLGSLTSVLKQFFKIGKYLHMQLVLVIERTE